MCKACKDTGIVIYHKVLDGIDYEYAAQCNCEFGTGKEYDGRNCKDHPSDFYLAKAADVFGVSK